jgi:hypothetical protein
MNPNDPNVSLLERALDSDRDRTGVSGQLSGGPHQRTRAEVPTDQAPSTNPCTITKAST